MCPAYEALAAAGFYVIVPDFAGHGQTPPPDTPWGMEDYAAELCGLLDALGVKQCHIVGHSFGGRAAIVLAAKYPGRVGKMALTGAAGIKPKRGLKYYYRVYKYKTGKTLAKTRAGQWACGLFGVDIAAKIKSAGSADYRALDNPVMRATFIRVVNQDLTGYLSSVRAPTLLLWGKTDDATPLWMGRKMEKLMADAALIELNGGHFAYLEQAAQFNAIVKHFFIN